MREGLLSYGVQVHKFDIYKPAGASGPGKQNSANINLYKYSHPLVISEAINFSECLGLNELCN